MIQRVQTIYLLLSLICLGCVTFGMELLSFISPNMEYHVFSYGVLPINPETGLGTGLRYFSGYFVGMGLMVLGIVTLFLYKNPKRQHKIGRMYFYTYFLVLVSALIILSIGESKVASDITGRQLNLGFFLFVAGLPFAFLANVGIKRDKKLLESLDRLR